MKNRIVTLLIALLIVPIAALARNYDVKFDNVSAEKAIERLMEVTKQDFVYQKELLNGVNVKVSGDYRDMTLDELLDNVITRQLGLSYRLVNNTVVLGKATKGKTGRKIQVKGIVYDNEGYPVPGASVTIKGEPIGVATNIDGEFQLTAPEGSKLIVAYIGMNPYETTVTGKSDYKVTLNPSSSLLDEVIVTGYQEVKKEKMTGSTVTLKADKLEERYTANLLNNLEGHVAGLSTYGGKPIIRGSGTLYGNSAPLLVVDGLPVEGDIEDLNPYDIESVNVLKDAASAAIYGARAANGIIVVTTKNAKNKGKIDVDFQANVTWYENRNVDYHDNFYMTAEEQVTRASDYYDYYFNRKYTGTPTDPIESYKQSIDQGSYTIDPVGYAWYQFASGATNRSQLDATLADLSKKNYAKEYADAVLRRQVMQQYNLSLRSSSDKARNSLVLNYRTDNMGIKEHKSDWLNVSFKGSYDLANWLTATFSVNGIYANTTQLGYDYQVSINPFQNAPYYSFYNEDGSVALNYPWYTGNKYWTKQEGMEELGVNIMDELKNNQRKIRRQEMRYHADLLFRILPGLTAQTQFVYEVTDNQDQTHYTQQSHAAKTVKNAFAKMENGKLVFMTPETGGILNTSHSHGNYWTARGQLNFNRTFFDKHDINIIAGLEFRETKIKGDKSLILGFDDQLQSSSTHTVDLGTLSQMRNSPYFQMNGSNFPCNQFAFRPYIEESMGLVPEVRHRYGSGYFNATYTFDNRYNVFGSYRKDHADVYGLDAKFRGKPLWSVGAGWNIHNESFMHDFTWLDFLKLRVSYGVTGNIYQGATSLMTASSGDLNSDTNLPVATITSPANPDLRWEQNKTTNVGIDYGFFGYRLRGSLDYYVKTGKDIFAPITLDPTTGFSSMVANAASIQNKGIELAIGYDWFQPHGRNSFSWSTNMTVTYNKNEVTAVENPATRAYELVSTPYRTGYPVNALWAYRFAKIDDRPGLTGQSMYYVDNGNISHNASSASVESLLFGGQSDPKTIIGLDNQLKWNGISLGILLAYYGGHKMFAQPKTELFESSWDCPVASYALNAWTPEKPTDIPGIGEYASTSLGSEARTADNCLYDADFIKIRNIVLGYDLPEQWTRKAGINKVSLRFQVNDPKAIWTKNSAGIDPETLGLRKQASYMFGINLSL